MMMTTRQALDAVDALGFDVAVEDAPGQDWVRLDEFAADPATLDGGLRLAGLRFGLSAPSRMTGGWLIAEVAAAVAWPTAAMLLTGGPTLIADAADVRLPHPATGRRRAVRIATPAADEPATPSSLAGGMVAALTPVVGAVHRRTRRGPHALWGTVTDMVAAAFHRVGDRLDLSDEARALATQVIASHDTLLGGANWCDVAWTGGTERTRVRNICCLWYRTDGGELCVTCPRLSIEDRRALVARRRQAG